MHIGIILRIFSKDNLLRFKTKSSKLLRLLNHTKEFQLNTSSIFLGHQDFLKARIKLGSIIWRVFCFFDEDKLVILLNGFQKKTQKTLKKEIDKATRLMTKYFAEKQKEEKK